jgi:hypothetical protein
MRGQGQPLFRKKARLTVLLKFPFDGASKFPGEDNGLHINFKKAP